MQFNIFRGRQCSSSGVSDQKSLVSTTPGELESQSIPTRQQVRSSSGTSEPDSVISDTLRTEPRRNRRKDTKPKHKYDKTLHPVDEVLTSSAASILSKLVNLSNSSATRESPERAEKEMLPAGSSTSCKNKSLTKSSSASRLFKLINISAQHKKDKLDDVSNDKKKSKDNKLVVSDKTVNITNVLLWPKSHSSSIKTDQSKKSDPTGQPPAMKKRKIAVEDQRKESRDKTESDDRVTPDMILSDIISGDEEERTDSIVDENAGVTCETNQEVARSILQNYPKKFKRVKMCGKCADCKKKCGACKVCGFTLKMMGKSVFCFVPWTLI